jgi:hypothetical protein
MGCVTTGTARISGARTGTHRFEVTVNCALGVVIGVIMGVVH